MIEKIWSGRSSLYKLLLPFSWIYGLIVSIRYFFYQVGIFKRWQSPVPVIIVGNLTVGGNGKTPFVIWLVEQLSQQGFHVAVISRGYGGKANQYPLLLTAQTSANEAGDEPVLIAQRTKVPVAVAPKRQQAIEAILAQHQIDVIIADDGLQHYALKRDIELVIVDGHYRFGNGWWLPAGPMRERVNRLKRVDATIINGEQAHTNEINMRLIATKAINLVSGEARSVNHLTNVVAMAGIGHPERFFQTLKKLSVNIEAYHTFADHYRYRYHEIENLVNNNQQLLMTEKDAVKCQHFAKANWWYLPIEAQLSTSIQPTMNKIIEVIQQSKHKKRVNE